MRAYLKIEKFDLCVHHLIINRKQMVAYRYYQDSFSRREKEFTGERRYDDYVITSHFITYF